MNTLEGTARHHEPEHVAKQIRKLSLTPFERNRPMVIASAA